MVESRRNGGNNISAWRKVESVKKIQMHARSEKHSLEDMIATEEELKQYSKQIDEMRNRIHALAYEKWTKNMVENMEK